MATVLKLKIQNTWTYLQPVLYQKHLEVRVGEWSGIRFRTFAKNAKVWMSQVIWLALPKTGFSGLLNWRIPAQNLVFLTKGQTSNSTKVACNYMTLPPQGPWVEGLALSPTELLEVMGIRKWNLGWKKRVTGALSLKGKLGPRAIPLPLLSGHNKDSSCCLPHASIWCSASPQAQSHRATEMKPERAEINFPSTLLVSGIMYSGRKLTLRTIKEA